MIGRGMGRIARVCACALLASLVALPISNIETHAQIQGCNTTMTTRIDQHYQGPVFVKSYWTESSMSLRGSIGDAILFQREVAPGEGKATLAVELLNRSTMDISAATVFLNLPEGFEPVGTSIYPESRTVMSASGTRLGFNQPAVASYNSVIPAKSSFTLYFDVDISDKAKVGTVMTQLVAQYYRVSDPGLCTSALITFPLVLSGKTVLDIETLDNYLVPKNPNSVSVMIVNKGTADATGVIASIIGLGDSRSTSSRTDDSAVVLQSASTKLINLGANTFTLGTIAPGTGKVVKTVIFPSQEAAGTVQNMDIQITYGNAYGDRQIARMSTGLVVQPSPIDASLSITYHDTGDSHILVAEKLGDLSFVVANNGQSQLSDVLISILPQSPSVTIVGSSKWSLPVLEPGEARQLSTKVMAARNMIGSPTAFSVDGSYIVDGEERTDSLNLGAFITGDVNIHVYDLAVNYVGNTPHIVGSILNQGNAAALYANINLLSSNADADTSAQGRAFADQQDLEPIFSQYVGDIAADSSIPFSIPVRGQGILQPGPNTVALKITYADSLKNFHEMTSEGRVDFVPRQSPAASQSSGQQLPLELIQNPLVIMLIVAAIAAAVVLKRRSSSGGAGKTAFESDLDSLLDTHVKDRQEKSAK